MPIQKLLKIFELEHSPEQQVRDAYDISLTTTITLVQFSICKSFFCKSKDERLIFFSINRFWNIYSMALHK